MSFRSILRADGASCATAEQPGYFRDLNLDQIVTSITKGREEYELEPFFHHSLHGLTDVAYRQDVMRDVEQSAAFTCLKRFAETMRLTRERLALAKKYYDLQQKQRWFMHAVESYCLGVGALGTELERLELGSQGMREFREFLRSYIAGPGFRKLQSTLERLSEGLDEVRYAVLIKGNGFKVRRYEDEADYSKDVAATFEKFRQGATKDYRVEYKETRDMNHIEAKVLEFVSLLYPELFAEVDSFCAEQQQFRDPVIARFDREIQFYMSYIDYMGSFRDGGLNFCYPELSDSNKTLRSEAAFDLALAIKLIAESADVVCNDFHLDGKERIFLVSGPNQGGKTTFSRVFGQLHHLASLGLPVPGRIAQLFLPDQMFTHYEREETIESLRGKLQDDLVRIHEILQAMTPRSVVIMNEIFNSTTLRDAVFLARRIMEEMVAKDAIVVCVTFLDELMQISDTVVSMVSTVVPDDPATRTYRVVRRPPDGRSYAISIAQKYHLTYDDLIRRIPASDHSAAAPAAQGTLLAADGGGA